MEVKNEKRGNKWGLGKYLILRCNFKSSKVVRSLLSSHRITVNGIVETSYSRQITPDFLICVDGILVSPSQKDDIHENSSLHLTVTLPLISYPYIVAYYKPCGIVCTMHDEEGRDDLRNVIPANLYRDGLHPVGRLDQHSCGLLLFTTDGRLTRLLLNPSSAIPRRYECVVTGSVDFKNLSQKLLNGVEHRFGDPYFAHLISSRPLGVEESYDNQSCLDGNRRYDGPIESAADWNNINQGKHLPYSVVILEVCEGKQRMVRRMLAHCDHHVLNLKRIAYGMISLGELLPGQARQCQDDENVWATELLTAQQEVPTPTSPAPLAEQSYSK